MIKNYNFSTHTMNVWCYETAKDITEAQKIKMSIREELKYNNYRGPFTLYVSITGTNHGEMFILNGNV